MILIFLVPILVFISTSIYSWVDECLTTGVKRVLYSFFMGFMFSFVSFWITLAVICFNGLVFTAIGADYNYTETTYEPISAQNGEYFFTTFVDKEEKICFSCTDNETNLIEIKRFNTKNVKFIIDDTNSVSVKEIYKEDFKNPILNWVSLPRSETTYIIHAPIEVLDELYKK